MKRSQEKSSEDEFYQQEQKKYIQTNDFPTKMDVFFLAEVWPDQQSQVGHKLTRLVF